MEKSRIEIMEKVIAFSDKLKLLTFDDIYNRITNTARHSNRRKTYKGEIKWKTKHNTQ